MTLFNRVRGAFYGIQADVDPHSWRLPSPYPISKSGNKQTIIPNPKTFANAFIPSIPSEPQSGNVATTLVYPDVSHAAVHLALLECFRNLRLSASALDVKLHQPPSYEEKPKLTSSAEPTRFPESQRWDLLIKLAITRFAAWWSNIDHVMNHAAAYAHHASDKVAIQLAKDYLPPLDVLLVWYAFMLDSDAYYTACRNHERHAPRLQQLCFPWPAICDLVDTDRMGFTLPRAAQNLFSTLSGQSSDILTYLERPPAYTDASTLPFEAKLYDEVKKHEKFIDEAHNLMWIRSPALSGSLARASVEYLDYHTRGKISDQNRGDVPFGIDLLWRTHRLFPEQYGIFLNNFGDGGQGNDSKASVSRSLSCGQTVAEQSEKCLCWTCERIRDNLPGFVYIPPPRASTSSSSPSSSFIAVTQHQLSSLTSDQLRQIQDDLGFYRAVESARTRGDPLPTRPSTAAEKETERIAREKQKEVGYLPGLHEYVEILPDGTRKIRRQKHANPSGKWRWV